MLSIRYLDNKTTPLRELALIIVNSNRTALFKDLLGKKNSSLVSLPLPPKLSVSGN